MADKVEKSGYISCYTPDGVKIQYELTVPAQTGVALDLWIITGATYSIDTLTVTYDGKSVTLTSGDYAIISEHITGEFFYRRGVDELTITGVQLNGNPVTFGEGEKSYTLTWDTPNTAPVVSVTAGVPFAGSACGVSWRYSDEDNDSVSLVSLIRYYRAAGASSWTKTTLLTAGTAKAYTDTIPTGYGGGEMYYEVVCQDTYGGTGTGKTDTVVVIVNTAPSTPGVPLLPGRIDGGAMVTVSWTESTDAEGNLEGYKLERSADGSEWVTVYQGAGNTVDTAVPAGISSVAYRVMAYDTYGAQSGYAVTETLTVYNNAAPPAPASITVPGEISTGTGALISWASVVDPDGDAVIYRLERSVKGENFAEIYSGEQTAYTDTAEASWETVAYRVCAEDAKGARSPYRTSGTREVILNFVPVLTLINAPDGLDYGVITEPFMLNVSATDKDKDPITLTFLLDDVVGTVYTSATPGEIEVSYRYLPEEWQQVPNGQHTLTIKASDGTAEKTAKVRFTKEVRDAVISLEEPMTVSEQIEVCVISVDGTIPEDADMTVEVTNNGNDPSPVWEDATAEAKSGMNFAFSNQNQVNGWAFNFRVTVHGGDTRGYITSIQGGFQ